MGGRTTLALLLFAGALGAILWFTQQTPPVRQSAAISALDGRSLEQCKRVRWQFRDHVAHELTRSDDGLWQLAEPIVDRASRGYVNQIMAAWESAELIATEMKDDADGRAETGLDAPEITFLVEWPDGHRVAYDVGAPGPLGTDRFLRREGKIWRGGTGLYESMRVNLDDLRDRQVFRTQESFCTGLRVEHPTQTGKRESFALERNNGAWFMAHPVKGRAEPVAAVRFVTAVLSLRADEFLSGLVRRPERDPDVVVEVRGGLGDEALELWLEQGAAFGPLPGRPGRWFQCDPRNFEGVFENAVNALRARALITIGNVAEELAGIVVDPGQGRDRIHLLRESVGSEWRLTEPAAYATHPTRVNELIQAVNNLRAVEFVDDATVDDASTGLGGKSRLAVSLRTFAKREAITVWLGAAVQRADLELVHACRADDTGTIILTPAPVLEHMQRDWTAYCNLDVVKIAVQVGRIELHRPGGEQRQFGRVGDGWKQTGSDDDRDDIGQFVNDSLRDLRARRAVDLRDGSLGDPSWTLRFCRGDGDLLQQLRVWDRGAESPLVVQPDIEGALGFELNAFFSKQLRALWQ